MKSLFEEASCTEMIERIRSMKADTRPQWGKMNAAQMLAHCQTPFKVATGQLKLKRTLIGRLLGGWAKKKFVISDDPFKPNGPTDPRFVVKESRDFDQEQPGLIGLVKKFSTDGLEGVTQDDHPFFGPMSAQEWDRLMWKHLDHHLRQFGK